MTGRLPAERESAVAALAELEIACRRALTHVQGLLIDRRVQIRDTDTFGWGQWLDEAHRIKGQWGRYGTSAGVQALALTYEALDGPRWHEVSGELALATDRLFPPEIPEIPDVDLRRHEPHADDPDPWKDRDFVQPMKVAFCVDALSPDCVKTVPGEVPVLVRHLIALRLDHQACWTTRKREDPVQHRTDRLPLTALVLYALRRFPQVHSEPRVTQAYEWLAGEMGDTPGVDVHALCGLALLGLNGALRDRRTVSRALHDCDATLVEWIREHNTPIVERPWFNAYVDDADNVDYMFLSPEIVVSLYFLERGLTPETQPYVYNVVTALTRNINGLPGENTPRGLRVQASQEGTVDQLWAVRLFAAFKAHADEQLADLPSGAPQRVLPPAPAGGTWRYRARRDWGSRALVVASGSAVAGGVVAAAFAAPAAVVIGVGLLAWPAGKVLDAVFGEPIKGWVGRRRG